MSTEPLVSVIIVFFNAERFIGEAIESVFAQSYRNWELVLVDDGSTDGSSAFARRCVQEHPATLRYLTHPRRQNRGISASRNLGIANAIGIYVAFLDSDDVWFPNKLEEQVSILQSESGAAMVYGSCLVWHSWTDRAEDLGRDLIVATAGVAVGSPHRAVDIAMLSVCDIGSTPSPSGIMVRRSAVEAVGGFEDEADNLWDDLTFYFKLGLRAVVLASGVCWYKYRQHPNSCCAIAYRAGTHAETRHRFLTWALRHQESSGLDRPDLEEALQRETFVSLPQKGLAAFCKRMARRVLPYTVRHYLRMLRARPSP